MRNIVLLLSEQASILAIAGALEPFMLVDEVDAPQAERPYALWLASRHGGQVNTLIGHSIDSRSIYEFDNMQIDTLMICAGFGTQKAVQDRELIDWVAKRGRAARRICTLGSGVWIAAEAGLLSGRRVNVHWRLIDDFRQRFPTVHSEADEIFLRDGPVWSCPALSSAIDLALALIEEDLGRDWAMTLARLLVVFMKRPSSQPQVSTALQIQMTTSDRFDNLHTWIFSHLNEDLSVEKLAYRTGMSVRNFTRVYTSTVGITPARSVEAMRIEAACRALKDTNERISEIAKYCGFGDEERMRRAFMRVFNLSPTTYRNCDKSVQQLIAEQLRIGAASRPRKDACHKTPDKDAVLKWDNTAGLTHIPSVPTAMLHLKSFFWRAQTFGQGPTKPS